MEEGAGLNLSFLILRKKKRQLELSLFFKYNVNITSIGILREAGTKRLLAYLADDQGQISGVISQRERLHGHNLDPGI